MHSEYFPPVRSLSLHGTFKDGVANSIWSVIPASGAGDLQGLRGEVNSALGHAKDYPVEFN